MARDPHCPRWLLMDAETPAAMQRSVEQPEVVALLREGWEVRHVEPMEDHDGHQARPKLALLLTPPRPAPVVPGVSRALLALHLGASLLTGLVVGALLILGSLV